MGGINTAVLWVAIVLYLAGFVLFLTGLVFNRKGAVEKAWLLSVVAFVVHTLTIAIRWVESGHPPVLWRFEHALAGSWFVMAIYLSVLRGSRGLKVTGLIASGFALLMLGYGLMSSKQLQPLPPPYQSGWLWIHVGFGWLTYGSYHIAAGTGILYLLKDRAMRKNTHSWLSELLPSTETLEDVTFKLIVYGFIAHIVMLGSGAIWAYGLWGRYWAWDPIETWSLISWLVYALVIHLRVTYGWKGRRFIYLAIVSVITIIILFGGIGFAGGVHTPLL